VGAFVAKRNLSNVTWIPGVNLACAAISLRTEGLMTLRNFRKLIASKMARNFKWKGHFSVSQK